MSYNFKDEEDVKAYLNNIYMEYRFGCEGEKKGDACHLLGDYMEGIKKEYKEAADIYKSNCDERNWPRSCAKFAGYKSVGRGCTKDMQEAFTYMKKSCDLDDARGCVHAGKMASSKAIKFIEDRDKEIQMGIKFLEKACHKLDNEQGCFILSTLYLGALKDELKPNYLEAYKLSLKSCEAGNPYACANISQMHARGEGVEKNSTLAESFKERARSLQKERVEAKRQLQFQQGIES